MFYRYGLTTEFADADFVMEAAPVKKYWSKASALNEWYEREQDRLWKHENSYRWVVINLRSGEEVSH